MAIFWRFLRLLRWTILIVLAFVTGMGLVLTLTEKGRDNLAGIISDVASSDDMKIKLSGLDGIWSGYLKVGNLVIEDADGPWLAIRNAEIDWSPLALFSWTVRTERIHADRIEVARRPKANASSGGGGGLPVRLSLKGIDLPDVALGPELAGGVASVSAKGFVEVSDAPMVIDSELDIKRTDGKVGSIAAKVSFVPADNKLDIDIVGSEPQGGIIANLLKLPGEPAVDVLVSGSGPAANWKGSGTVSIDKVLVTRVEGTHVLTDAGSRIEAKGDGEFARFLPERFRPVLSGRTVFDIAGMRGNDGAIAIERADIESNALKGTAKGTINPAGATDFALELNAANGGLPLVFGSTESPIDITVGSASIRAFGDGKTPALDIAATLPVFDTSNTRLENVAISLHSDEFDVQGRIGPVSGNATAAALIIDNPTLAPLVAGKVSAELEGTLSTEAFAVSRGIIRSDAIDGNFSGTVALTNGVIGLDLNATVLSSALPAPARPALADKVTITAELVRDDQGNTSANSLAIQSGGLTGNGQIKLGEQTIDVDLKGRIADIAAFAPQAKGAVDFALVASGDKRVPDVTATITSDQVGAAGRELKGLNLTASGKADTANPAFDIKLAGDLSGQPVQGSAVVSAADGSRELRDVAVSLGDNRITGALKLVADNVPEGTLTFDLKNVAALAAPTAPDLKGSVAGTATFGRDGGSPQLVVDAAANVAMGANAADGVKLSATVTDYLAAPKIEASVSAPSAKAGDTEVKDAEIKVTGTPEALSFDAKATARDVPVVAQGTLRPGEGGVAVDFDKLEATVQGVPIELSSPSAIASVSGVTTFDNLTIDLGGGKAIVSGTAGEALDLTVRLTDVPASLANSFRPGLDAAGTVSGSARVTGSSASPAVAFDVALADGEVAQTRAAGLQPLGITAKGTFADKALAFDATASNPAGLSLAAKGNVSLGESSSPETIGLSVNSTIVSLPASLANAFVPNLGAAGIIEGTVNATGTAADPSLAYDLRWTGAETAQGRAAGVPPLALTAKGSYADKAVGFVATARNASGLSVNADGSVMLGTSIENTALAVNASIAAFPAALANSFVPGLDAAGAIEGTLNTSGPASAPSVAYDLRWNGAETAQTRARGIAPLNVSAKGNFAEGALGFDVAARNGQGIALDVNGSTKLAADQIEANVSGRLADVAPLAQGASGAVDFSLAASGAKATPDLSLNVSSDRLTAAGREITGLKLSASGKADMANPAASVTLAGNVAGQALNGNAVLSTAQGRRTIKGLSLTLGPNRIAGDLELDDAFVPLGSVNFDVPDLGPLAALAFETVSGSLSGNAQFSRQNGVPRIVADATVKNFARGEISGQDIALDATVDDYLAAPVVSGTVRAASVTSGKTVVSNIAVDLSRDGPWTAFDGGATVSGIPAKAKGRVQSTGGATTIELSSAEAVVQGIRAAVSNAATVRIADGRTTLDNLIVRLGSGQAIVSGTAGETLDLNVRLSALPVSLANSFSPGLGAAGNISGTVKVTGAASAPSVAYDIDGSGVEVAQTRAAGVGALSVSSAGTFAGNRLSFNATAGGAGGLSVRAGGTVNTASGPALDLIVTGTLPFSVLSGRLAAQGLALSGSAAVDLRITGTAASPIIGGSITSAGARFIDARSGIALNDIGADIAISNGVATVRRLGGSLSGGGSVAVTGTVGINPGGGFPADLAIRLADARYTDGRVVTANLGGDLAIKGPLTSRPTLSGTINLARTVITIPERLPSSLSTLDVKHKNPPAAVRRQDQALKPSGGASGGSGALTLDLTVNAPERIFVQGRGLDAELGGSVRLTGSTAAPQAVGQFDLRRGRLQLLGKRLTFSEGTIGFAGSLVPTIDFSADTTATDATVTVRVSGQANNPRFSFTSAPALPEDEVLARLVFGRSMSNLSPLQIAQLADAVAQLSGSGGATGLLQSLRSKIGVDDLDIRTDEKGGTSVAAGKYLNDRTYLSLEKGEKPGSGKATIDLNVGKGVKLRGQASDSGEAKGGIFFEREY